MTSRSSKLSRLTPSRSIPPASRSTIAARSPAGAAAAPAGRNRPTAPRRSPDTWPPGLPGWSGSDDRKVGVGVVDQRHQPPLGPRDRRIGRCRRDWRSPGGLSQGHGQVRFLCSPPARPDLCCFCVSPCGHTATTVTASISAVSGRRSRGSLVRMRTRWPSPLAVAATMASTVSARPVRPSNSPAALPSSGVTGR